MTRFDEILPKLADVLGHHAQALALMAPVIVNRDLNGRVRLMVDARWADDAENAQRLNQIAADLYGALGPHGYPPERGLLFEGSLEQEFGRGRAFPLPGVDGVHVVDRLATDTSWSSITPPTGGPPRVVFFSIKGGVGRSTALAATAWSLAEGDTRVLVLDLDLESPGLSTALLPEDRRPAYGIADWLVEDLVDNGDSVLGDMVVTSELSRNGEIMVVPAHGQDPGEYVSKLGRVWMPRVTDTGVREAWAARLDRLLVGLEARYQPDVILIDSRAGIDEVAATCLTELGASSILLFAIDGDQTWSGYRILFSHWRRAGVVAEIRERLQVVGAMVPDTGAKEYFDRLRERAWNVFTEELYDEVPPGALAGTEDYWSFDETDLGAPHYPWAIRWRQGFAALTNLHDRLNQIDPAEAQAVFGPLMEGVRLVMDTKQEVDS